MPVVAQCRECGKQYRMKDELVGEVVPCKECGAEIRVPGGARAQRAAARPARRPRPKPASKPGSKPGSKPAGNRPARDEDFFETDEDSRGSGTIWIIGGAASVVVIAGILVAIFVVFGGGGDEEPARDNDGKLAQNDDPPGENLPGNGGEVNPPGGNGNVNPPDNGGINPPPNNNNRNNGNPGGLQPPPPGNNNPPPVFGGNPPVGGGNNNPGGLIPAAGNEKPKDFGQANVVAWRVKADPPKEPLTFTKKGRLTIKSPKTFFADALFPTSNAAFVALGANNDKRSYRDVYDLRSNTKIGQIGGLKLGFTKGKLSPNGLYFAVKTRETNGIGLWDVKKKKALGVLPVPANTSLTIFDFAGPDRIVAAGRNTPLWTWSLPDGKPGKSVDLPKNFQKAIAFSPGGRYAAMYCRSFRDWTVRLYDLDSGSEAGRIDLPDVSLSHCHMAFSPDGTELGIFLEFLGKSHLFAIDVANGKQAAYLKFKTKVFHSNGPGLQWFPDKSKWLVMSSVIVDRKAGPVWALPKIPGAKGAPRVMDDDRIVLFGETNRVKGVGTFQVPHEQIAKAVKVVGAGGTTDDVNLPPLSAPDWKGTRELASNGVAPGWKVQSDPAAAGRTAAGATTIDAGFGRPKAVLLSRRDAARALVLCEAAGAKPDGKTPVVRLDWYDVGGKRSLGSLSVTYPASLLAFSPSGTRALLRDTKTQDRLDCWSLDEKKPVAGWRPFKDEKAANHRKITAAAFLDDDHVLTLSGGNKLALWKLPECKALYVMGGVSQFALSPGGKYVAVAVGRAYRFFDSRTGQAVGDIQLQGSGQAAAFHPDGSRFAAVYIDAEGAKLGTWDLTSGKSQGSFPLPVSGRSLHWCGNGHLLMNNASLIDLANKMIVWTYSGFLHAGDSPDGRHWYVSTGRPTTLTGVDLPDAATKTALAGRRLAPRTILKPGMKVSLSIALNGIGQPNLTSEIAQSWTRKLQARGITVAPGQPVTLFARATKEDTGKTSTFSQSNSRFGFGRIPRIGRPRTQPAGGRTETVNESVIKCRIVFGVNNRAYGERKSEVKNVYNGMRVTVRKDETVQSHVDKRQASSAAGFFRSYAPPGYIFESGAERGLGTSQFVSGGARVTRRP